jgi:hypothetical protein
MASALKAGRAPTAAAALCRPGNSGENDLEN